MKGRFYTYKDSTYLVLDEGLMKEPNTREWIDCLTYSPVVDGMVGSLKFVRAKKEFIVKFKLKE